MYPDLERRFLQRWRRQPSRTLAGAGLDNHPDSDLIGLEDHTGALAGGGFKENDKAPAVPEGIVACVGNTPLFRIQSLSEETGCEILAKAEVRIGGGRTLLFCSLFGLTFWGAVYERGRRGSQGQSSVEYDHHGKFWH